MADETITCDDLDEAIERYTRDFGFRLDMITPADDPREALVSKDDESLRLVASSKFKVQSSKSGAETDPEFGTLNSELASDIEWSVGRAGMMYRDLVPDRHGGKVIASHIRIVDGGDVADRVHYHKIDFQIIYCLNGAIRVVYEDQGEPFWLRPGDCVLQPPEIRHRVLVAEAGSEVVEITSPAEHETWFDHEMKLPIENVNQSRVFRNQPFARHMESKSNWIPSDVEGLFASETEISGVRTLRYASAGQYIADIAQADPASVRVLIDGKGIEISFADTALRDGS